MILFYLTEKCMKVFYFAIKISKVWFLLKTGNNNFSIFVLFTFTNMIFHPVSLSLAFQNIYLDLIYRLRKANHNFQTIKDNIISLIWRASALSKLKIREVFRKQHQLLLTCTHIGIVLSMKRCPYVIMIACSPSELHHYCIIETTKDTNSREIIFLVLRTNWGKKRCCCKIFAIIISMTKRSLSKVRWR